jgi:hypothetical protein
MNTEKTNLKNENPALSKGDVTCRYYKSGGIGMGLIVGVYVDNIKHQDGEHTFLTGRQPEYQWIRTADLYDTYEEAKNAPVARFYNVR